MFSWFLTGLFIIAQLGRQCFANDPMYLCHAWGDPHVQTWRLHGTQLAAGQQQDCYSNGQFDLVKNDLVHFTIQTNARLIIQVRKIEFIISNSFIF